MAFYASIFFFFTCNTSSCDDNVLKILILRLSDRFQISSFIVTPLLDVVRVRTPFLCLAAPREHLMYNSHIVSNSSFDISPFPTMFNRSRYSSLSSLRKMIFKIFLSNFGWISAKYIEKVPEYLPYSHPLSA